MGMKNIAITVILLANALHSDPGLCGSTSSTFNSITKDWVIPDFWPSDAFFSQGVLNNPVCATVGIAKLYRGCRDHDKCYGSSNMNQDQCDKQIYHDWLYACARAYKRRWWEYAYGVGEFKASCEAQCDFAVDQMSSILNIFGSDAFADAQAELKQKKIDQAENTSHIPTLLLF